MTFKEMFLVTFKIINGTLSLLLPIDEFNNLQPNDYIRCCKYSDCRFENGVWTGFNNKGNIATIIQGKGEVAVRIPQI